MEASDIEQDLAGLDRVLLRLATTEDDRLEEILTRLFPAILTLLRKRDAKLQKKVLDVLAHINKRMAALPQLQLPLDALIDIVGNPESDSMERNFALVYLEKGCLRATPAECFAKAEGVLNSQKLGFLSFSVRSELPRDLVFPLCVASSADPVDLVSLRAQELVQRLLSSMQATPPVDLESEGLVRALVRLVLGPSSGREEPEDALNPGGPPPPRPELVLKVLPVLSRSVRAASALPEALSLMTRALDSPQARVRAEGMHFASWALRHSSSAALSALAPEVLARCLGVLALDSSTPSPPPATAEARGQAFQLLGLLARRAPALLRGRVDVAQALFRAQSQEPPGTRALLQEALVGLAGAVGGGERVATPSDGTTDPLEALLTQAAASEDPGLRGVGLRWTHALRPRADALARWRDVLAAGDKHPGVAELGRRGLGLDRDGHGEASSDELGTSEPAEFLTTMTAFLTAQQPRLLGAASALDTRAATAAGQPGTVLSAGSFLACLEYSSALLRRARAGAASVSARVTVQLLRLARAALAPSAAPAALLSLALGLSLRALPSADPAEGSALLAQAYGSGAGEEVAASGMRPNAASGASISALAGLAAHPDAAVAWSAAKVLGALLAGPGAPEGHAAALARWMAQAEGARDKSARLEESVAAVRVLGCAAGNWALCDLPGASLPRVAPALERLAACAEAQPLIRAEAAVALGCAGGELGSGGVSALEAMQKLMVDAREDQVARMAVRGISMLLLGSDPGVADSPALGAVQAILARATERRDAVQSEMGYALTAAFGVDRAGDFASSFLRGETRSLADWEPPAPAAQDMEVDESSEGRGAGEDGLEKEEDIGEKEENSVYDTPVQTLVLEQLLTSLLPSPDKHVRSSAAQWALCLLSRCAASAAVQARLLALQGALTGLLGDEDDSTQDAAGQALARCFQAARHPAVRRALLESLQAALGLRGAGASAAAAQPKLAADTRVFAPGALGSAPGGGNLSTYRELCSLASDAGQPQLLYQLMGLARHERSRASARGAAGGLAGIAAAAGAEALRPALPALLPRLCRLRHDPDARVRGTADGLWAALAGEDGRGLLKEHLRAVLKALRSEAVGRGWAARQGAALALAALLGEAEWEGALRDEWDALWEAGLRLLDDIKESVRAAALALVQALASAARRLCEQGAGGVACATLPILVFRGFASPAASVRGICLALCPNVVRRASEHEAAQLAPLLPTLLPPLLDALSGAEDARLNYLELHAAARGIDTRSLDAARSAAALAGPAGEALDLALACRTQPDVFRAVAQALAAALRRGQGVATRAGAARSVAKALRAVQEGDGAGGSGEAAGAARYVADAKSPVALGAAALLKAAVEAALGDPSEEVRRAAGGAAASAMALAPKRAVREAIERCLEEEEGGEDRALAGGGGALSILARSAPDILASRAADIMPRAFLFKHDPNPAVREAWAGVWDELAAAGGGGLRLHSSACLAASVQALGSSAWRRRRAGARAAAGLAQGLGSALGEASSALLEALCSAEPGRMWEGKEDLLGAMGATLASDPVALFSRPGKGGESSAAAPALRALLRAEERGAAAAGAAGYAQAAAEALTRACEALRAAVAEAAKKEGEKGSEAATGGGEGAEQLRSAARAASALLVPALAARLAHSAALAAEKSSEKTAGKRADDGADEPAASALHARCGQLAAALAAAFGLCDAEAAAACAEGVTDALVAVATKSASPAGRRLGLAAAAACAAHAASTGEACVKALLGAGSGAAAEPSPWVALGTWAAGGGLSTLQSRADGASLLEHLLARACEEGRAGDLGQLRARLEESAERERDLAVRDRLRALAREVKK